MSLPLKDISNGQFWSKLTEVQVILIELKTIKLSQLFLNAPQRQLTATCWVVKASRAATKLENKKIQAEGSRVSADTRQ